MRNFSKKTSFILIAAASAAVMAIAPSVYAAEFEDFARVINVTPQVEQVNTPRQECRTEYETVERTERSERNRRGERDAGGSIVGGIAGGLLGAQVGNGNGRIAAAAAGAIAGAIVGDRIENGNDNSNNNNNYNNGRVTTYEKRPVRQCRNIDSWETRTTGYAVTYEYHNRTYTTVMPYDPGNRLRLQVSLTPRP